MGGSQGVGGKWKGGKGRGFLEKWRGKKMVWTRDEDKEGRGGECVRGLIEKKNGGGGEEKNGKTPKSDILSPWQRRCFSNLFGPIKNSS